MTQNVFPIGLIVFLIIGLIVGLQVIRGPQRLAGEAAPATTLSFSPATINTAPNQTFTANIQIDTGENRVSAVELHLSFNVNLLQATAFAEGSFFDKPMRLQDPTWDNTQGVASFTLGAEPNTQKQGSGILAQITFQVVTDQNVSTQVSFAAETRVAGIAERNNVLVGTTPLTVNIGAVQPTPTSTPIATPTSTPTQPATQPTLTPSPTPAGGDQPQPSPTPTPSPRPSPQPTFTLAPTPSSVVIPTSAPQPTGAQRLPEGGTAGTSLGALAIASLLLLLGFALLRP